MFVHHFHSLCWTQSLSVFHCVWRCVTDLRVRYIYAYIFINVCIYTYVHIDIYCKSYMVYICICVHMYIYIYMFKNIQRMYTYTYVYKYTYMNESLCHALRHSRRDMYIGISYVHMYVIYIDVHKMYNQL